MKKWAYAILTVCLIISSIAVAAAGSRTAAHKQELLPRSKQSDSPKGTAKVTGTVLDADTQKPVPGAKILADGVQWARAGKDGKFLITKIPNGAYNWRIQANGYHKADYWRYSVHEANKADIFTFLISKTKKISKSQYPVHAGVQEVLWEDSQKGFSKTLKQAFQRGQADGIRLESVDTGKFTDSGEKELLAIFVFDAENPGGLECKVAAVFNKKTKKLLSYVAAAGKTVDIDVFPVQGGASRLRLSWTSIRQGFASQGVAIYQAQAEHARMEAVPME